MSDDKEKEKEEDDALSQVSKAAKAIQEIAALLGELYAKSSRYVRPEYLTCAKSFRKIASDIRGYSGNLLELLSKYYYFSFYQEGAEEAFHKLCQEFRKKNINKWVSDIRFRCGDIETEYSMYCKSWIDNPYGKHVSRSKQKKTAAILERFTQIDADIVNKLTNDVLKPLSKFIDEADGAIRRRSIKGIEEAERIQMQFRLSVKPLFNTVESDMHKLEDAVQQFDKIAKLKPPRKKATSEAKQV